MARTATQDEELNNLYIERRAMEDGIISLPENRAYQEFPGWVELNNKIEEIVNSQPESIEWLEEIAEQNNRYDDMANATTCARFGCSL